MHARPLIAFSVIVIATHVYISIANRAYMLALLVDRSVNAMYCRRRSAIPEQIADAGGAATEVRTKQIDHCGQGD